ncbi:hypothetical protein L228DRAFT_103748 [Xylona heveae TC161]|uniref:Uncharacterized protein n=1 Tax=Xylona heveae (strain CBS 132557 / TC161) TaxID=1328760 RepID=A0A165IE13_XYLHT|nr:hypothetical protein L228DRAFT_103748 [Xylona heveae TC161]KZF24761.1 hypothetical protein L228DRAFT_103748 [Xylona heveae TC161]
MYFYRQSLLVYHFVHLGKHTLVGSEFHLFTFLFILYGQRYFAHVAIVIFNP